MRNARVSRRSLLRGGAGAAALAGTALAGLTITGCAVSDPSISGSQPTQIRPGETPLPQGAALAKREATLAALAEELAAAKPKQANRFGDLARAHRLHEAALADDEPVTRPSPDGSPTPGPTPVSPSKKRLKALEKRQARQLREQREAASAGVAGESGTRALLLGSVTAFAAAAPSLKTRGKITFAAPVSAVLANSEGAAAVDLLKQLYAIVYGYQAAAGPLRRGSPEREQCLTRLAAHKRLSDTLVDALAASETETPVAEPVYALPFSLDSRADSVKLRAQMESALLPYLGSWLALAGDSRASQLALGGLQDGAKTAASLGGDVPAWPGFND